MQISLTGEEKKRKTNLLFQCLPVNNVYRQPKLFVDSYKTRVMYCLSDNMPAFTEANFARNGMAYSCLQSVKTSAVKSSYEK